MTKLPLLLMLAGAAAVVAGVARWDVGAALVVAGILAIALGVLTLEVNSRDGDQ